MSTQTQPAPVLARHREAEQDYMQQYVFAFSRNQPLPVLSEVVAAHDPHQETVRLLEEAVLHVAYTGKARLLHDEIRAHLAALQQEGAAK